MVGCRRTVDFRAGGNHQLARVINIRCDNSNDGVWIEAESTVTTVSQEISRPNGA